MKKVVLITNYFHFESEKSSNRYRILADFLAKDEEIELEVITSRFYQRTKTFRTNFEELTKGLPYKVTFIDEPGYQKNISFKRLRTSKVFARNTVKYLKSKPLPDLIYQVIPTVDVADQVGRFANQNQIPFVIDIQDLWPEAFKMAFNVPILSNILFYPIRKKADRAYKNADAICAVSQTYVDRALSVNKRCKTGHSVFIGINLSAFDRYRPKKEEKTDSRLKLVYCGSLEKSYDIETVIDALAMMKNPPLFVVLGDGNYRPRFESYAKEKNVEAEFTGFLPYPQMVERMCKCDITVNPIIGSSVSSIINKHGDYAASGLPVINTQNSPEYRALVDSYRMGFNCNSGDATDVAKKLEVLCEDAQLRREMGKNARRCAEEKFNRDVTYFELVATIKGLL